MCNQWCLEFASRALGHLGPGTRVLEVGSLDVNGTVRSVLGPAAASWHGIDIRPGPGVDEVLDVSRLSERFGPEAFDLVASTEMLEHCHDWQGALAQMLGVLRPGGLLLLTTRSPGFPLHDHPADHWRFDKRELARVVEPVAAVVEIDDDFSLGWPCGVGLVARRRGDGADVGAWLAGARSHRVVAVDPAADAFSPNNSRFVPFHEYSAHRACAEWIERIGPARPRVLDLSAGTGSRLKLCAPRLEVEHRPVDAASGPPALPADAFAVVVAVDTLHRLTPAGRDDLLGAMAAAATDAVLLAEPLPSVGAAVDRLRRLGFEVAVSPNGFLPWAVPLAELWRRCEGRPDLFAALAPLLADAHRRFAPLDHLEPAQRGVVAAVRGRRLPAPPPAPVEAYREASREMAAWWAAAAPLFDRAFGGTGTP
jgi:SAM-dependent methyltransferase